MRKKEKGDGHLRSPKGLEGKGDRPLFPFLTIDRGETLNLQDQIRQRIVERVAVGSLAPTQKLPSTRALARHLKVSRNTVAAAYQRLVADGHLEARPRSGIYVSNARYAAIRRDELRAAGEPTPVEPPIWERQLGGSRQIERADGRAAGLAAVSVSVRRLAARPLAVPGRGMARGEQADALAAGNRRLGVGHRERRRRAAVTGNPQQGPAAPRHPRAARRGPRHRGRPAGAAASRSSCSSSPARASPSRSLATRSWSRCCGDAAPRSCSSPWTATGWWWTNGSPDCRVVYVSPGHQRPTGVALSRATARGAHGARGRA